MFKRMFLLNQWLWFHILGAIGIYALGFKIAYHHLYIGNLDASMHFACNIVVLAAFGWELFEFIWKKYIKKNLEATYGTKKNWFFDTVGDIIGAILTMTMLSLFLNWVF